MRCDPTSGALPLKTEITAVTAYASSARLTRAARSPSFSGSAVFMIGPLSAAIDPASLTASAEGARIISARVCADPLAAAPSAKAKGELKSEYDAACAELEAAGDALGALEARYGVLVKNCGVRPVAAPEPERIEALLAYFSGSAEAILRERRETRRSIKEIDERKTRLENRLGDMSPADEAACVILLELERETQGSAEVTVSYNDGAAGWTPRYDLRAEGDGGPVELSLFAEVLQRTGEDWPALALTLAAGDPPSGGVCPELEPCRVEPARPRALAAAGMRMMALEESAASPAVYDAPAPSARRQTALGAEFRLREPVAARDGETERCAVLCSSLKAAYAYRSVPKEREAAYLTASLEGWKEACPLPGDGSVFVSGGYAGEIFIDPEADDEALELSLGECSGISVKRTKEERFTSRPDLLGRIKRTVSWTLTALNRMENEVTLELVDQIPVSADAAIEIAAEELSGAALNAAAGELRWSLRLAGGESRSLAVRYAMSYSKSVNPVRVR